MLLMGLRLREGIDLDRLAKLGGVRPGADAIAHLKQLGMVDVRDRSNSARPAGGWRRNERSDCAIAGIRALAPEGSAQGVGHNATAAFILNAKLAALF